MSKFLRRLTTACVFALAACSLPTSALAVVQSRGRSAPAPVVTTIPESQLYSLLNSQPAAIGNIVFSGSNDVTVTLANGQREYVHIGGETDKAELRALATKAHVIFSDAAPPADTTLSDLFGWLMRIMSVLMVITFVAFFASRFRLWLSRRKPPLNPDELNAKNAARYQNSNTMQGYGEMTKARKTSIKSLKEGPQLTWADIGGADNAVTHFKRIARWASRRQVYDAHGAKLPKGFLIKGPPGTGKTLLARVLCMVTDGDGVLMSGSDFTEMFVGVGASRVRDVFGPAKKYAKETGKPYFIVIDEIDAVGGRRGGHNNGEQENTLNAILTEMDGVLQTPGVIVIGMTNRDEMLDPALTRPGRLEYHITVGLPDLKGREHILRIHKRGKTLAPDVDVKAIARKTWGNSGADLAFIMSKAAMFAADRCIEEWELENGREMVITPAAAPDPEPTRKLSRRERKAAAAAALLAPPQPGPVKFEISPITNTDIELSIQELHLGETLESKQDGLRSEDKNNTVWHEAGHALGAVSLPDQDPITHISTLCRSKTLGVVVSMPDYEKISHTKRWALGKIVMAMCGRVAQVLYLDAEDAGAIGDFEQSTDLARTMVISWGMSALGHLNVGRRSNGEKPEISESLKGEIDHEWRRILELGYDSAVMLLKQDEARLRKGAQVLGELETMTGEQWNQLMETIPAVCKWAELPIFRELKVGERQATAQLTVTVPSQPTVVRGRTVVVTAPTPEAPNATGGTPDSAPSGADEDPAPTPELTPGTAQ